MLYPIELLGPATRSMQRRNLTGPHVSGHARICHAQPGTNTTLLTQHSILYPRPTPQPQRFC